MKHPSEVWNNQRIEWNIDKSDQISLYIKQGLPQEIPNNNSSESTQKENDDTSSIGVSTNGKNKQKHDYG